MGYRALAQDLLEIETQGKRYRIEKGFLDAAASRLLEWTGERFEPMAEANAADDLGAGLSFRVCVRREGRVTWRTGGLREFSG